MATANEDQIAEWNGTLGQGWATMQTEIDRIVRPFGDAALKAAAACPGERVVDIGCGCGDTSIELARSVGDRGSVLGVDVSRPMLDVARARATQERLDGMLSFVDADASSAALPSGQDLLYSRFGVMFFDQPTQAFTHMRHALRTGGRCVFVCWRTPSDNPWAMTPLVAARKALNVTPAPTDPTTPGPFAFADGARLRRILADAGFQRIALDRFDTSVIVGPSLRAATEGSLRMGPTARLAREVGPQHSATILRAVESALAPFAGADGAVRLTGSTWIASATNGA
ncbi:MAG: class I SAM-dependent methyltransferase [Caldimonas sp.]